jgi:hypothetical protein
LVDSPSPYHPLHIRSPLEVVLYGIGSSHESGDDLDEERKRVKDREIEMNVMSLLLILIPMMIPDDC